jgi:ATP-dependent Clp protease ATP-binding subunit ClpB
LNHSINLRNFSTVVHNLPCLLANLKLFSHLQLNRVKSRLKQQKIHLQYTPEAVELLGSLGFDPNYGARPVKRVIQQMVENEIALGVLKGDFKEDDTVLVDVSSAAIAKGLAPQKKLVLQRVENINEELVAND